MPAANSSGPSRRRSRPQARSIAVRSITKNICKSAVWPPATSEPVLVEDTISKLKGRAETLGLFIQKPDFLVKEKWRRGWDTHLAAFAILPCFQQHARKPHEYWLFQRSRLFQPFLLFQPFGS